MFSRRRNPKSDDVNSLETDDRSLLVEPGECGGACFSIPPRTDDQHPIDVI